LPWVYNHRGDLHKTERDWPRERQTWHKYLNCDDCTRIAEWGCGHLSESTDTWMRHPAWPQSEPEICPGYLISLPAVGEVISLYRWWESGQLKLRLDGRKPTPVLMTYIDILASEIRAVEGWAMAEATSGNAQGRNR